MDMRADGVAAAASFKFGEAAAVSFNSVGGVAKPATFESGDGEAAAVITFNCVEDVAEAAAVTFKLGDGAAAATFNSGKGVAAAAGVTFKSGDSTAPATFNSGKGVAEASAVTFKSGDSTAAATFNFGKSVAEGVTFNSIDGTAEAVTIKSGGSVAEAVTIKSVDVVAQAATFNSGNGMAEAVTIMPDGGGGLSGADPTAGFAPAGGGDLGAREEYPLGIVVHDMAANFQLATGGVIVRQQAAVLAMILGAMTIVGEPDTPWPNQLGALLVWLGGCIALFLSWY